MHKYQILFKYYRNINFKKYYSPILIIVLVSCISTKNSVLQKFFEPTIEKVIISKIENNLYHCEIILINYNEQINYISFGLVAINKKPLKLINIDTSLIKSEPFIIEEGNNLIHVLVLLTTKWGKNNPIKYETDILINNNEKSEYVRKVYYDNLLVSTYFKNNNNLLVNGQNIVIEKGNNSIKFLGSTQKEIFKNGVNIIESVLSSTKKIREKLYVWYESNRIEHFQKPYKNSYAIIVAIDDYKATGFYSLKSMTSNAKQLKATLMNVGFEESNFIEFYNKDAISKNILEALQRFWKGGDLDYIDRLLFYFGGHGSVYNKIPFLVTFDFNNNKPTLTSILMKDLTRRHAENISARHMIVAIDACHSGLSITKLNINIVNEKDLLKFHKYSKIKIDTCEPSRNYLLAGTGNQKAIWENGGLFTKALITGLDGNADLNNDNIIQFDELSFYIRNDVIERSSEIGIKQTPKSYSIDTIGKGKVLFIPNHFK